MATLFTQLQFPLFFLIHVLANRLSNGLFIYRKQSVAEFLGYGNFRIQSRGPDHQHPETVFLVTRTTYNRSFIVLFIQLLSVYRGAKQL